MTLHKCIQQGTRFIGCQRYLHNVAKSSTVFKTSFPVLDGVLDESTSVQRENNREASEHLHTEYKSKLKFAMSGGGEKAVDRHVNRNRKLLADDRVRAMLDEGGEWLELSTLAGLGMVYGDVPRSGCITGIGQVNGVHCMFLVNDATVKGGTMYPITVTKQLRAQEIAKENRLPCIYIVDSGGAFLPLQADIFPDKNHGGRAFRNEAIMNSMEIPQLAIVCGSCTAGGAYVPTMCQEAVIVDKIGTIFLGGPPLVYAALKEVVTAEALGGATLHSSVSGCTDHFATNEEEAFHMGRAITETFGIDVQAAWKDYEEPIYDSDEIPSLIPHTQQHRMDIKKVLARVVDGSRFQEFKTHYGETVLTGFARVEGNLVGIVANNGSVSGDAATKASHFVQLCDQRRIPLVFLQNTTPRDMSRAGSKDQAVDVGIEMRMHARLMSAIACTTVPKITFIIGNSFGIDNYLMGGRSFDPRFVFSWPNARLGIEDPEVLLEAAIQARFPEGVPGDEESKKTLEKITHGVHTKTSALYSSSRLWDDGVVFPQHTRQVLGHSLRIINQSCDVWSKMALSQANLRM